jgi:Zc3h12a-like ribonuclease protein
MSRAKSKPEPPKPEALRESHSKVVLVDGSNVAFSCEGEKAVLKNILCVRDRLFAEGFEPIVLVDAALRHKIDDEAGYERLVDEGVIKQAPAGTDADYFILSFADELNATIVSNDRFKDRIKHYPALRRRLIKYMIVQGEVVFEKRTGRRE